MGAFSADMIAEGLLIDGGGGASLAVDVSVPQHVNALVIVSETQGRNIARTRAVAAGLSDAGVGVVLADLLTEEEALLDERTGAAAYDIGLLARRLRAVVRFVRANPKLARLPRGFFASGNAAAAALVVASTWPGVCGAVVSHAGRPDLAWPALPNLTVPTLFLVHGRDLETQRLHRHFIPLLLPESRLALLRGGDPLDASTQTVVARWSTTWFRRHLTPDYKTANATAKGGSTASASASASDAASATASASVTSGAVVRIVH